MNDIEGPISFLTVEDIADMLRLEVAAVLALPIPRYVFLGGGTRFPRDARRLAEGTISVPIISNKIDRLDKFRDTAVWRTLNCPMTRSVLSYLAATNSKGCYMAEQPTTATRIYEQPPDAPSFYSDTAQIMRTGDEVLLQFYETIPGPPGPEGSPTQVRSRLRATVIVSLAHAKNIGRLLLESIEKAAQAPGAES